MNNEGLMIFIIQAILALFAFFVVAPCVLNAVSLFTVQKRFARTMIDLGVVKEDVVKKLHPKKEIAGVFISLLVVAAFGFGVWKQAPISYLSGGLPLIVGFLKYRQVVQFNSLTVKRFQNTYIDSLAQLARMQGSKIRFTDIRPGFVATEMAKGEGLFWVMPVDRVVEGIVRAIRRRRSVAVVTRRWLLPAWLIRHMPECIYRKMG